MKVGAGQVEIGKVGAGPIHCPFQVMHAGRMNINLNARSAAGIALLERHGIFEPAVGLRTLDARIHISPTAAGSIVGALLLAHGRIGCRQGHVGDVWSLRKKAPAYKALYQGTSLLVPKASK